MDPKVGRIQYGTTAIAIASELARNTSPEGPAVTRYKFVPAAYSQWRRTQVLWDYPKGTSSHNLHANGFAGLSVEI